MVGGRKIRIIQEGCRLKIKIEHRQGYWKDRRYKTIETGKRWKIERPYEFDLEKGLENLLRRKEKWE